MMPTNPDCFVGTLLVVGSFAWVAIATTRYGLMCLRDRRNVKRLEAMSAPEIEAAIDAALTDGYDRHVADALRMVKEAPRVPKPREPIYEQMAQENPDAEVARLRAELEDPTLVRIWMSS